MSATSTLSGDLAICDLRDRPEFRQAAVDQNFISWGKITDLSHDEMAAQFELDIARGQLPVTFIAVLAGKYAGCVSLRQVTLGALKHPEIYSKVTPWLSNMWVADEARGHGIAGQLTEAVLNAGRSLGFRTVYSSTATENSLYHKMGFKTTSSRAFGEHTVYLIEKQL